MPIDNPENYGLKTQTVLAKNYELLKIYVSNLERYLQRVIEDLRKSKIAGINNLGVAIELDFKNMQIKYLKELSQQLKLLSK